jgi:methyltransferase (TIGR00027 family)
MTENRSSATARLIAQSMVLLSRDRKFQELVPPGLGELSHWFVREAGSITSRRFLTGVEKPWFRSLLRGIERMTLPGIVLHYLLRKLYLEEVARTCLREGFRQVVVLAAGFDTLGLRLCREHPNAQFIEIDHPMTQRVKAAALCRHHLLLENLTFVPADFTEQNLGQVFSQTSVIRPAIETLVLAEGILMYLTAPQVTALFKSVREAFPGRCRFAFTVMEPSRTGNLQFQNASPLVNLWLRLKNEPFRWGISSASLPDFLNTNGFALREMAAEKTFRERYLSNSQTTPLAKGEYVCVADSDGT